MSTFDAAMIRAVSIELRSKTVNFYFSLLPIWLEGTTWTLNALDAALPAPYDIKLQLDAYQALSVGALRLNTWVSQIQQLSEGDPFNEQRARAVAIELRETVNALYFAVLPIWQACSGWMLNGLDPALPLPYALKIQIDAYLAISALPRLRLNEWATQIQAATNDDTLTYPTPPNLFDGGTGIFDGGGNPNP